MPYQSILMIDDDADDQEIFSTALEQVSRKVQFVAAGNAAEALAKLAAKVLEPDVIFLDLNMPVMNGQQFLLEIKKIAWLKYIPVIIFSTSSHPATIQLMMEMGAHNFITKPHKFDDLITLLRSVIL